ncbi:MAG TPA: hypothetical protein VFG07_03565 [Thermoplasmata archaeon]|nr:hypothetical protein [Thermoplasmata archaeon]
MMWVYHELLARGVEFEVLVLVRRSEREALRELRRPLANRGLDPICSREDPPGLLDRATEVAWETSSDALLLS